MDTSRVKYNILDHEFYLVLEDQKIEVNPIRGSNLFKQLDVDEPLYWRNNKDES